MIGGIEGYNGLTPTARTEAQEYAADHKIGQLVKTADSIMELVGSKALSEDEKLRAVANEFESVFVNLLMKQMRSTVPENDFFGGGAAEKTWRELQDQELSRELATKGSFGVAEMVYDQLKRHLKVCSDTEQAASQSNGVDISG